jgi:hypothetical protein
MFTYGIVSEYIRNLDLTLTLDIELAAVVVLARLTPSLV